MQGEHRLGIPGVQIFISQRPSAERDWTCLRPRGEPVTPPSAPPTTPNATNDPRD